VSIVARVESNPGAFEKALPNLVYEICSTCAVSKVARMEHVVARAVEAPRSTAWLVGGFAALALGMAGAGIYGVVSHGVLRRTRELGVRLALGSGRLRVAALVVGASFRSVAIGIAGGLGASWLLARLIRNLLFGVAPNDLLSFTLGPLLLLAIAVVASAAPVIRAVRIDPSQSLREE
jgi:ABC-type antimicrobial peptide transport system permease subunit